VVVWVLKAMARRGFPEIIAEKSSDDVSGAKGSIKLNAVKKNWLRRPVIHFLLAFIIF